MANTRALHTITVGTQAVVFYAVDEYEGIETITGISKVASGSTAVANAFELTEAELLRQGFLSKLSCGTLVGTKSRRKTLLIAQPNVGNRGQLVGKTIGAATIKTATPKTFTRLR